MVGNQIFILVVRYFNFQFMCFPQCRRHIRSGNCDDLDITKPAHSVDVMRCNEPGTTQPHPNLLHSLPCASTMNLKCGLKQKCLWETFAKSRVISRLHHPSAAADRTRSHSLRRKLHTLPVVKISSPTANSCCLFSHL